MKFKHQTGVFTFGMCVLITAQHKDSEHPCAYETLWFIVFTFVIMCCVYTSCPWAQFLADKKYSRKPPEVLESVVLSTLLRKCVYLF